MSWTKGWVNQHNKRPGSVRTSQSMWLTQTSPGGFSFSLPSDTSSSSYPPLHSASTWHITRSNSSTICSPTLPPSCSALFFFVSNATAHLLLATSLTCGTLLGHLDGHYWKILYSIIYYDPSFLLSLSYKMMRHILSKNVKPKEVLTLGFSSLYTNRHQSTCFTMLLYLLPQSALRP